MQLAERNYKIYNNKLLTIVEVLTKWRQYLLNATEKFEIWMDHKNLKYFWELYKLNGRQERWYLKLQDYDFILQYILEKTNIKADVLSRKDQVDTKEDNKDIKLLKKELWTRRATTKAKIIIIRRNHIIRRNQEKSNERTGSPKEIGKR